MIPNYTITTDLSKKKEKCDNLKCVNGRIWISNKEKTMGEYQPDLDCEGTGNKPIKIKYKAGECKSNFHKWGNKLRYNCPTCYTKDGKLNPKINEVVEIPICKNCGHGIISVNSIWEHKEHSTIYQKKQYCECICDKPEPIKLKFLKVNKEKCEGEVVQVNG